MSHVTDIKLRIHSLDALDEACQALGLELHREQKTFTWWGRFAGDSTPPPGRDPKDYGTCEHAIRIAGDQPQNGSGGPWEIGVVEALDGNGFDLLYDQYGSAGRRLTEQVGVQANRLRQEYAAAVAIRKAQQKLGPNGFVVSRERLASGRIRLRAVKR